MRGFPGEDLVRAFLVEREAQRSVAVVGEAVSARRRRRDRRRGWWEKRKNRP